MTEKMKIENINLVMAELGKRGYSDLKLMRKKARMSYIPVGKTTSNALLRNTLFEKA